MSSIRFGLIGAGAIARHAAQVLATHPTVTLAAIADPSEERRVKLATAHGIPRHCADAAGIFSDRKIDAVYIATPTWLHADQAVAALTAGQHVLLEKPFAMSLAEAERVAAAARASGKVFMVGMNQRFNATSQQARRLVADGRLGEVYHAKACWLRRSGIPGFGSWFTQRRFAGGGCLMDIGVHLLDLALYLLDDFVPESVFGRTYAKFGPRGLGKGGWGDSERDTDVFDVDDFATALIRLRSGRSLTLDVSWAMHQKDDGRMGVQIYGTEGGINVADREIYRAGADGSYEIIQGLKASGEDHPKHCRFANFIDAVHGEAAPCVGLDEALAVQRILDGITESCRTGAAIAFPAPTAAAKPAPRRHR
jgi:predicted dehydrogenase